VRDRRHLQRRIEQPPQVQFSWLAVPAHGPHPARRGRLRSGCSTAPTGSTCRAAADRVGHPREPDQCTGLDLYCDTLGFESRSRSRR
jgi:hypothetical protein